MCLAERLPGIIIKGRKQHQQKISTQIALISIIGINSDDDDESGGDGNGDEDSFDGSVKSRAGPLGLSSSHHHSPITSPPWQSSRIMNR